MTLCRRVAIAVAASALCVLMTHGVNAQERGKPGPKAAAPHKRIAQGAPKPASAPNQAAKPAPSAPPKPSWASRCTSDRRKAVPECAVEQRVTLAQTGQLVASVAVRLPPETGHPVMMIHVPVGLFLPAGIKAQIDDQPPAQLAVQTCDLQGCYAGNPVSPEMLAGMKAGKHFKVMFQNLGKETITVPFDLANFAEAYARIQ